MRAIVLERYGTPDVLKLREVRTPIPKADEVLVRVHAASINDWDWAMLTGSSFLNRLMTGLFRPRVRIIGCDIAGRVESVGASVTALKPGDEVFGDLCMNGFGAFAEYACAGENTFARKPAAMTLEQAAAIPQAGMLAVQGLIDVGKIKPGQEILLNGAGGGVGTFAIQMAKQLHDVEVTAVDSADKLEMLSAMGADHVVDYKKEDFTNSGKRYDLILDVKTNRPPWAYARALNPGGTYATVGGSIPRMLQMLILSPLISGGKRLRLVMLKPNKDLGYMSELFESGKVRPVLDRTYALTDIAEAFRFYGTAKHKGKIVITVD